MQMHQATDAKRDVLLLLLLSTILPRADPTVRQSREFIS